MVLYKDGVNVAAHTSVGYPAFNVKYSLNNDYKNNYVIRAESVRIYADSSSEYQNILYLYINDNLVASQNLNKGTVTYGELIFQVE